MKETITIEKKVFDTMQKNNLDLMDKLDRAKECLKFYADVDMYEYYDKYETTAIHHDYGQKARDCLEEIRKAYARKDFLHIPDNVFLCCY